MNRVRMVCCCLLAMSVGAGVASAQETRSANSSQESSSSAAKEKTSPAQRVVLKVGDRKVTQAEFESQIEDIEPQGDPDKGEIDKDRRKLGEDYASVLMLSRLAVATHLDATPDVKRQLEVDRLQILSDAEFAELMRQSAPKMEEIRQYYSAHLSDFDRVRIRRLFIWKVGGASKNTHGLAPDAAKARADAILQAAASGQDATKLADAFKDSDEAQYDAEASEFSRGALPPKMEKVAFGLKEGEWAMVDDTPDSVILVQLVKRGRRSLEEVSSLIQSRVQAQRMQLRLAELKKKAGIWMDEDYFGPEAENHPSSQQSSKLGKSAGKN